MFWALAQVFVLMYQDVSGSYDIDTIQNYLAFAIVGLMVGSVIAATKSRDFIETGFIPMGMIGVSVCMFLVPFFVHPFARVILYSLTGLFGGLFFLRGHSEFLCLYLLFRHRNLTVETHVVTVTQENVLVIVSVPVQGEHRRNFVFVIGVLK